MIFSYLRLAIRTFLKNKAAFLINLIGMGIALGCCITAWVNYEYNAYFDKHQSNASQLYRIAFWEETEKGRVPYGISPFPAGNLIRENLRDGDHLIQYTNRSAQFRIGDEMFQTRLAYAESAFTRVFTFDLLRGSLSLDNPSHVLISDQLAITYFGSVEVVGRPLTQIISGEPKEFIVGGVYKEFPSNSSFRFDLLTSYRNYFSDPAQQSEYENDWSKWTTAFLYLKDAGYLPALKKQLDGYIPTQNEARPDLKVAEFYIEPFVGMSARAVREHNQGHWLSGPMPPAAVVAPFVMAGFLLLVACFNYMNNAIAIAGNRLKEIGIRKVIGGRRKELIFQFLAETMVFCLAAMGLGLVLAEYFVAGWNSIWNMIEIQVHFVENYVFFTVLFALIVVTAMLAGGYPAFYISAFKPIQILRGTTRLAGANLFTRSLLVFQFSISLAAVIFALSFYFNAKFQKAYDLGYSWRSVIQVPVENGQQFERLRNAVASLPQVDHIGGTQHQIYSNNYKAAARFENGDEKEIDVLNVGDNYFQTLNVRILEGENFTQDQSSDVEQSIIVNEHFVRVFGLEGKAIGKRITLNDSIPLYIKAVVKDVYLQALFQPLTPVAFRYVPQQDYQYLVASTDASLLTETNARIKAEWAKLFPNQLYPGRLMEERMVMTLEHFDGVIVIYTFLGLVAVIMSISGLYSLVALYLQKRTHELSIRKILGAPLQNIIGLSSRLFLIVMVISFAIGSVLGTLMVNALMNSVWEYYEAVNLKVLSLAIVILFTIAVATIGYRVIAVSLANPVDSLKRE
ncbi:MAG: ABC transporter permease [Cyclobacteriaceae bacterium]